MEYEKEGLLHEMFQRQAKKTPDKIAVVSQDRQVTYKELDELTDVVAINLRIKGVQPDSVIGIYMERSLEYVIAYIAILKAGEYLTIWLPMWFGLSNSWLLEHSFDNLVIVCLRSIQVD